MKGQNFNAVNILLIKFSNKSVCTLFVNEIAFDFVLLLLIHSLFLCLNQHNMDFTFQSIQPDGKDRKDPNALFVPKHYI